ncbi:MAG: hypothetical protein A3J54_00450 [Candidatus Ryanbacteria bacterium RIFCSPHIGHO2_02_FULL_45_13b]|uniref:Uncharacterized protein n=1 Tax=Candidatus Ryanbacteria bacterium RIFCSPHIGHO2_02_FULL_45_13b TaxID=1802117 RepID=A0A1G2G4K8_9BACT|nr:MAG: hypothetical protein A3J54_00450 [Candidatus Ryanbacteria bacterium RIFCSPHIGHO2_02_FULL_45_13b]
MPNFTGDWISEDSFEETLISLIKMADPGIFADKSPREITEGIIAELNFIGVYNKEEMSRLKEYLRCIVANPKHVLWELAYKH